MYNINSMILDISIILDVLILARSSLRLRSILVISLSANVRWVSSANMRGCECDRQF